MVPELCAKIGKFAAESGNKAAVERFSREVEKSLSGNTVQGFKKPHYEALKANRTGKPVTRGLHGRQLKLGDLDSNVQEYIRKLRLAGGVVKRVIVIGFVKAGIVDSITD